LFIVCLSAVVKKKKSKGFVIILSSAIAGAVKSIGKSDQMVENIRWPWPLNVEKVRGTDLLPQKFKKRLLCMENR
jgi:hypothetical protein